MHLVSILPVLAFLVIAEAAAIDRNHGVIPGSAGLLEPEIPHTVFVYKRDNCWYEPYGLFNPLAWLFGCRDERPTSTSSTSRASTTTSTRASSSSSSAERGRSSMLATSPVTSVSSSTVSTLSPSVRSTISAPSSSSIMTSDSSSVVVSSPHGATSSPSATLSHTSGSSQVGSTGSTSSSAVSPSSLARQTSAASSTLSTVSAVILSSQVVSPESLVATLTTSWSVEVESSSPTPSSSISASPVDIETPLSTAVTTGDVAPTTVPEIPSSVSSAAAAPTSVAFSGWRYDSDIAGGINGRALTAASTAGQSMTVETCLAYCDSLNFPLAGLEYGAECYCGSVLSNGASISNTRRATMPCAGDATQLCGGPSVVSLYVSTKPNAAGLSSDYTSQAVSLPAGWSSNDCIQEVSGRALVEKSTATDDMTIDKCLAFCGDDFKYAGLEYGRECYCGNTLSNGASLSSTSGQCVVPCAGLSLNSCGGPNALQLYSNDNYKPAQAGDYVSTGCVQEVAGRALRGASTSGPEMTIETCINFCASHGFKIAGLEYGQECYCDNAWQGGAGAWSGQCNMACAGNAGQNCGGPNAINVYTRP